MIAPTEDQPLLPFWIALLFGFGSLICYLTLAVFARMATDEEEKGPEDFNLGVPQGQNYTELFGISLAAAGTPLSTVVAVFFMNGGVFGARLLFCPLFFATGVWLLYWVYMRARQNGYFNLNDGRTTGARTHILIPFLGIRLTRSNVIGHILLVVCALPLLGLLTLEIAFGIQIIDYITAGAFHTSERTWGFFAIFAAFMVLLLGYVFVGGFRAVLRSDVWQYKLIQGGVVLTIASLLILMLQTPSPRHWNLLWPRPGLSSLIGFYVPVIFVNLVLPLGLASSWQRFLAFERVSVDVRCAIWSGLRRTVILWTGLIVVSLLTVLLRESSKDVSLGVFFDGVQAQGEWFQLFIFPVLTIAALSAMYSCSDTCVSALLYLNEYKEQTAHKTQLGWLPRQAIF